MDKKRKLILIAVGIVVAIILFSQIGGCEKNKHCNDLKMKCCTESAVGNPSRLHALVCLETSASMKGYVKSPKDQMMENKFEPTISHIITDLESNITNVAWKCGNARGKTVADLYTKGIKNGDIFVGGSTPLEAYITEIGNLANDTTVTLFVSDMVLSMSTSEMKGNPYAIINNKSKLASKVYDACKKLNDNGVHVCVIQYLSDFNADYYYNCTNNHAQHPCRFKGMVINKRPYYVMVFGTPKNIKCLLDKKKNIFGKYEAIYASFGLDESDYKQQPVQVSSAEWTTSDPEATSDVYTLWTNGNWDNQQLKATLSFDKINVPAFVNQEWEPICHSAAVSSVNKMSPTSIEITFKPFNSFSEEEDISITFESKNDWIKGSSIDNDELERDEVAKLEGKTWAFKDLMGDIIRAYHPHGEEPAKVAEMHFKAMKK